MQVVRNGIAQRRRGVTIDRRRFVSIIGGSSSPYPTVANSRLWLSSQYGVYSDTAGATPAAVNDTVGSWRAVGGSWGTDLATQSNATKRPTLKTDGISGDGTDDHLILPSTISVPGAFTCYCVVKKSSISQTSVAIGGNQGTWGPPMNYHFSDGALYAYDRNSGSLGSKAFTTAAGSYLIRLRRNAANAVFYAATGLAEGASICTLTESYTLAYLLASIGSSSIYSTSNSYFKEIVLVKGDTVTDGGDAEIRARLVTLTGIDL